MVAVLTACGTGAGTNATTTSPAPSVPAGAAVIKLVADAETVGAFHPPAASARVGQVVAWVFEDETNQHTVTADDGSFDSGTQSAGYVFTHTYAKPGVYKYHCSLHALMVAQITITQ